MKKAPHIIWVCPNSKSFFRSKGEVRCRPGSVIPKLAEQGLKINVLIPHDPTLLPKSKLSSSRISKHVIHLAQNYPIEIIKLTRGAVSPGIYMAKIPLLEVALSSAVFSKAALALAQQINRPVDVFHIFNWEAALLPLYLEMARDGSRLFKDTRSFLNVHSLREQGNFAPAVLSYIGVPKELFHPDGIEFFGKISFLKAGLVFADGVGVIDEPLAGRSAHHKNGSGLEGVLDSLTFKLRRWASDRSLRTHLDAYAELLALKKTKPLLPHLLKKLHKTADAVKTFIDSWGPVPPERYQINTISFLMQSPAKAYAFWEWSQSEQSDYGLVLEDINWGSRRLLGRHLSRLGDYWIDVEADHVYVVELVGWDAQGQMRPLLRSKPLRISRDSASPNKDAIFIDVKSRQRYALTSDRSFAGQQQHFGGGGTAVWEWTVGSLPASVPVGKK